MHRGHRRVKAKTSFLLAAEVEVSANFGYSYENATTTTDADTYKTTASAMFDMDPARSSCMKAKVVLQRGTATATRGEHLSGILRAQGLGSGSSCQQAASTRLGHGMLCTGRHAHGRWVPLSRTRSRPADVYTVFSGNVSFLPHDIYDDFVPLSR